jgi:hypothetical protein
MTLRCFVFPSGTDVHTPLEQRDQTVENPGLHLSNASAVKSTIALGGLFYCARDLWPTRGGLGERHG